MKLRDYLHQKGISVEKFAARCNIRGATIWHYFAGRRKPYQRTAEKIEKETGGLVTVLELRGIDDRLEK